MDGNLIFAIEPIMVLVMVLAFGFWQLRELNQIKRDRETREAEEKRDAEERRRY